MFPFISQLRINYVLSDDEYWTVHETSAKLYLDDDKDSRENCR